MTDPHQMTPLQMLFTNFQLLYGNKVNTMWGDVPAEDIPRLHSVWADVLRPYAPSDWDDALQACIEQHPHFPPTLPEFVMLCRAARLKRTSTQIKLDGPKTTMPDRVRKQLREFVDKHRMPS